MLTRVCREIYNRDRKPTRQAEHTYEILLLNATFYQTNEDFIQFNFASQANCLLYDILVLVTSINNIDYIPGEKIFLIGLKMLFASGSTIGGFGCGCFCDNGVVASAKVFAPCCADTG